MAQAASRGKRRPLRSGFVAVIGRPNAGKSTLVNALLGRKIAIVTPHPQTTRTHLMGVCRVPATSKHPPAQIVLVDTPGVHRGKTYLAREMIRHVREGLDTRDLALFLADVTREFGAEDEFALEILQRGEHKPSGRESHGREAGESPEPAATPRPAFLVLNKIDRLADKRKLLPIIESYTRHCNFAEVIPISALKRDGLDLLVENIIRVLPEGPEYFDEGRITDQPDRFIAGEIVREKAMTGSREEVPHRLAVIVERFEEKRSLLAIGAVILCESPGQKAILIGKRGERIKQIGSEARVDLEAFFGRKIFLELHVLVREDWRENPRIVRELDWREREG